MGPVVLKEKELPEVGSEMRVEIPAWWPTKDSVQAHANWVSIPQERNRKRKGSISPI